MIRVTPMQRLILMALSRHATITFPRLLEYTGSTHTSLPLVLKEMEGNGWIKTVARYTYALSLTPIPVDALVSVPAELLPDANEAPTPNA